MFSPQCETETENSKSDHTTTWNVSGQMKCHIHLLSIDQSLSHGHTHSQRCVCECFSDRMQRQKPPRATCRGACSVLFQGGKNNHLSLSLQRLQAILVSNEREGDLSLVEYIIYIHFCDQLRYFPGVRLASSNTAVAYCANLPCVMT